MPQHSRDTPLGCPLGSSKCGHPGTGVPTDCAVFPLSTALPHKRIGPSRTPVPTSAEYAKERTNFGPLFLFLRDYQLSIRSNSSI